MWATGPNNFSSIQAALSEMGDPERVRAVPYIEDVPLVLGVTELAVSRSGAMTTAELLAWGVPAILVPLPTSAADHQTLNALALQKAGAARYLSQDGLTPSALWSSVADLAHDQAELAGMSRAARKRSRPEATSAIVTDLMTLLPEPRGVESA
jgi:UDP-N-acetylglucosamine--N-acetylmuramyl-(pentapeptide) pyrophosphoryl-undecaprenol N-acetylglucosamine transferase